MGKLDFVYTTSGLEASFRVISKVPVKAILDWDFGDDKGEVFNGKRHESYSYEESGFYTVTLTVSDSSGLNETIQKTIVICDYAHTTLPDSIYNLIDNYLPKEIAEELTQEEKALFIQKWQLYIGPLVTHLIPPDKYKDELWYEALENQLIMELAVFDYLQVQLLKLLTNTGESLSEITKPGGNDSEDGGARGDRVKQITTGPTEVQFYDSVSDSISSLWKTFSNAMQPGGVIDELWKNICTLAERLEIFLPFCRQPYSPVVPRVVDRRIVTQLAGPNPTAPLNRGSFKLVKKSRS